MLLGQLFGLLWAQPEPKMTTLQSNLRSALRSDNSVPSQLFSLSFALLRKNICQCTLGTKNECKLFSLLFGPSLESTGFKIFTIISIPRMSLWHYGSQVIHMPHSQLPRAATTERRPSPSRSASCRKWNEAKNPFSCWTLKRNKAACVKKMNVGYV